jgi:hypothetical protein
LLDADTDHRTVERTPSSTWDEGLADRGLIDPLGPHGGRVGHGSLLRDLVSIVSRGVGAGSAVQHCRRPHRVGTRRWGRARNVAAWHG